VTSKFSKSNRVKIFEVGPRDGLQNEPKVLSVAERLKFIRDLEKSGLENIEIGAFVRPDRVPQMGSTDLIYKRLMGNRKRDNYWSLVPNLVGLERAVSASVKNIAIFTATSNSFTKANIGMSIIESFAVYKKVVAEAKKNKMKVRGYLSTAFGCPYEGRIVPSKTIKLIHSLHDLGVDEVSIGDTIGVADPVSVEKVMRPLLKAYGSDFLAIHLHDTRGMALANALRAYDVGVRVFDASAGGLGGCPYAPGATGNLATEDLVYMFEKMGIRTGINLNKLTRVSVLFQKVIGKKSSSRYVQAIERSNKRTLTNW